MILTPAMAAATLGLFPLAAISQPAASDAPEPAPQTVPPPPDAAPHEPSLADETDTKGWDFSAAISLFFVPESRDYAQPTFTADHGWLHLEARYNYEALDTGSLWAGYNFSGELGGGGEKDAQNKLEWAVTPMLGGVFGRTNGIAPGYRATLTWWKLELSSEGEYLFDVHDHTNNFFYNWSSLTFAPVDWFYFGIVAQRTRAYQTDRDIQRGPLVGFIFKNLDLSAYVLNPDESKPIYVFTLQLTF